MPSKPAPLTITHVALYDGEPLYGGVEVERVELAEPYTLQPGPEEPPPFPEVKFKPVQRPIVAHLAFLSEGGVKHSTPVTIRHFRTDIPSPYPGGVTVFPSFHRI